MAGRLPSARTRALATRPHDETQIERLIDGQGFASDAASIYRKSQAASLVSYLQLLRDYRPGGWKPAISVEGTEHLDLALERGRGAVLWLPLFSGYSFGAKVALREAGFAVSHLSHPRHGFSRTRFGVKVLNPIRSRAEDRYLGSRLMLSPDGSVGAVRESLARLRANEIVSITAGSAAARPVTVPFFNGELQVTGGAPSLAHATRAPLLPVFPLNGRDGVRVCIEAPIARQQEERKQPFVERSARAFAERMEVYIRRHPDQWSGWRGLSSQPSS